MCKVKINKDGELLIERKGKYKLQKCPYNDRNCSDSCPFFIETGRFYKGIILKFCEGREIDVKEENFIDER